MFESWVKDIIEKDSLLQVVQHKTEINCEAQPDPSNEHKVVYCKLGKLTTWGLLAPVTTCILCSVI